MEVRKVNGFFIIFVIGYIGLSVVCASIMAYAQNSGIAVPDWIQYVMSEGIILLIAIIYMIVQKIDPIREIPYKRIGIVDVILSLVAGYCLIPAVLLISNLSMLFSTNYLEEGTNTAYVSICNAGYIAGSYSTACRRAYIPWDILWLLQESRNDRCCTNERIIIRLLSS